MVSSTDEHYVIRGGKEGYDRLLVLARKSWPATSALFDRAGLAPGMRCLDLGCGGGAVSVEMARRVAPGGTVVGFDMDGVKLELGRRAASELGLGNVEFRQGNVNDWSDPSAYDAIYSRFLLQHLRRPVDLLQRLWAGLRPGGLLIVEDADFEGWCCDPPNEAFDFFVRSYSEAARRNGGDPTTGRKLARYFREAGAGEPNLSVVQPVDRSGEAKGLPLSTLEFTSDAILAAGIATPVELKRNLDRLAEFLRRTDSLVSGPRVFQAWSRRESSP